MEVMLVVAARDVVRDLEKDLFVGEKIVGTNGEMTSRK